MSALPSFEPRAVCLRCRRPEAACYCRYVTPLESQTRVILLQHRRERDVAIGTAHMANLCLRNSELHVGVDWSGSPLLERLLSDSHQPPMLLFPGEGAADVLHNPPSKPITLVVVDGTWSNTKKMVQRCPELASLPRLAFVPPTPSEYRIRREPRDAFVSTIEALAHVLGVLEHDVERFQSLLRPFRAMVDMQIACRDRLHAGRVRHMRSNRRPPSTIPTVLREQGENLVCAVGEANAWPYGSVERERLYPDELVHWVAFRIATGDVFDFVVAPRNPLCPSTPGHIGLSQEALHRGGTLSELIDRWRAFCRDDDILCSWGSYATWLFGAHDLPTMRLDMRHAARNWMKRKIGTTEAFVETVGIRPRSALASGRAGRRLSQLAEIARFFAECPESPAPPSHRSAGQEARSRKNAGA